MSLLDLLLGRRLANREQDQRRIGSFEGVPSMGLDGIGSSAYGPEAALSVLLPLGAAAPAYFGWVMAPIGLLLLVLFLSYWQTIRAYPGNGGGYLVTRENLGTGVSLLAAAALMIDYVLNVAVGISAGVGALVSAVPALHSYTLALCLLALGIITLANLRGTPDAGRLFALPTYLFVASFAFILGRGLLEAWLSGGHPRAVIRPPALPAATQAATAWTLLRAFASGCTAMTGIEAVSNGMSEFREPRTRYGHRTLTAIVLILAALLAGITCLTMLYRIGAMDQGNTGYRSVLSQLAEAVVGHGTLYYVSIGSLTCVLGLSANTSFVAFPVLCRTIATDGFLPKSFAIAGHRLVYSVGILYLAVTAGLLLFVFAGVTDRLIPLFAIGAFLTFTLSQVGMMVHWRRARRRTAPGQHGGGHRAHLWINTIGALITGLALAVIVVAKFTEGAWITILIIPAVIALLRTIRGYYDELARRVRDSGPLDLADTRAPIVLVIAESWNKLTDRALNVALSLSPDVIAIHLVHLSGPAAEEHDRKLRAQWSSDVEQPARAAGLPPPRLVVLQAQYRAIHGPVLDFVRTLQQQSQHRRIAVLIADVVKKRWYQHVLHTSRSRRLRAQLLLRGGPRLCVVDVPWRIDERQPPADGARQRTDAHAAGRDESDPRRQRR